MRLFGISFSPWSEKARWALDYHRIEYRYEEHLPIVGELKLRALMRKPTGRVTVPVLQDDRWYTDSFDIARHADRIGSGQRLLPEDKLGEVAAWNTRSEAALAAGRATLMLKMVENPELAKGAIPKGVPSALKPLLGPVTRKALESFVKKYKMREGAGGHESTITEVLDALAAAITPDQRYLLGEFSYADIVMAVAMQLVSPVDEAYVALGPGGREAWSNKELMERYKPLLEWRDEIYAKHRRPAGR